ncbi:MAG: PD40 domain-containing protein [Myxococcaceae bacterium]|nr:PD40 domain-containing protein [Myxococcaceae bacterium]
MNGPAVSYDGKTIVFSGLPAGSYNTSPARSIGAWRLYAIDADGTNLRQVTHSDVSLDYSRFGDAAGGLRSYDDFDPAFLPDGRIVFASTRWPAYGQYSGVRTSNLHVVNLDGTRMHRITAERNGADRPLVDPVTGKIVYARWWRNHRFPTNDMSTVERSGGRLRPEGRADDEPEQPGGRLEHVPQRVAGRHHQPGRHGVGDVERALPDGGEEPRLRRGVQPGGRLLRQLLPHVQHDGGERLWRHPSLRARPQRLPGRHRRGGLHAGLPEPVQSHLLRHLQGHLCRGAGGAAGWEAGGVPGPGRDAGLRALRGREGRHGSTAHP